MNIITKNLGLAFGATAMALTATAGFAHHSSAMFDQSVVLRLEGTVERMLWQNPHSYMQANIVGANGNEQTWLIEFQSLSGLMRDGFTDDMLAPGEEIVLFIHPLRNGTTGGDYVGMIMEDGSEWGTTEATAAAE